MRVCQCRQAVLLHVRPKVCGEHTWQRRRRRRRLGALQGPISPVCSEGLFITASRREQYSAARQLHLLPFSYILALSLSLKHNSAPHWLPTVHHCTPVKPRLVAVGSPRFQSCRRCLECFSLSLYFSSVMFWEQKIHQTSWFFSVFFFFFLSSLLHVGSNSFKLAAERRERDEKTKAQRQAAFEGC